MSLAGKISTLVLGGLALSLLFGSELVHRADASREAVRGCKSFIVFKGYSKYTGPYRYRARNVKRSSYLRCSMVRKLLKAAYGGGPLKIIKKSYESRNAAGQPVGRPTYWLKGGWRCGNGAGGAACWNARRPIFNVIADYGTPKAVRADV